MLCAQCQNFSLNQRAFDIIILQNNIFLQTLYGVIVLGVSQLC
jgi:hypothetical protein